MANALLDAVIDSLKLIPFLFISFLIIEALEHKSLKGAEKVMGRSKKLGPLFGGILGAIPQCGFSVLATNLYVTRVITLGTLIAVYLSTSDEMLPVLLSSKASPSVMLKLVLSKVIIGICYGYLIDLFYKKNIKHEGEDFDICSHDHCHCERGILYSALVHTLKTVFYVFIVVLILNLLIYFVGEDNISKIFLKNNPFAPLLAALFGLIPNCAASVMLTELYLKGAISFGSLLGGTLSASGVSLLVLFRTNKDKKENYSILLLNYLLGAITGFIVNLF